jgi:hypothetical protein
MQAIFYALSPREPNLNSLAIPCLRKGCTISTTRCFVIFLHIRIPQTKCIEVPQTHKASVTCGASHQNRTASRIFMGYFATMSDKNAS